jgi:hypothetical protein
MGSRTRPHSSELTTHLKGRIAEAFVEAIFRRAGYWVSRVGRESQPERLIKIGTDEFLPDFLIRKPVAREGGERPLHRLLPVEVKYRHDVPRYLRDYGQQLMESVAPAWPDLCFIFVTDDPEPPRSCFQIVDLWSGSTTESRDLHTVTDLGIYESTVREYEGLVREIFGLLDGRNAPAAPRSTDARDMKSRTASAPPPRARKVGE